MKEMLAKMAQDHNQSVDTFINVTLKEHFGSDKINAEQWFEAQKLIREQKFYEIGYAKLKVIRGLGYDCKMDMQSNKLHWPEVGVVAY